MATTKKAPWWEREIPVDQDGYPLYHPIKKFAVRRLLIEHHALLAACEELVDGKTEFVTGDFDSIRAAIAKATGE